MTFTEAFWFGLFTFLLASVLSYIALRWLDRYRRMFG